MYLPNGEQRTAQFAIVDLDDITASHNELTFSSSEGYPTNQYGQNINDRNYQDDPAAQQHVLEIAQNLKPEGLIELTSKPSGTPIISKDGFVVSGNNRVMSLKLAVKRFPENYQKYKQYLASEADAFGFAPTVGASLLMNESIALPGSSYSDPKTVKLKYPVLVRIDEDIPALNTTELAKYNLDTKKGERPVDRLIKLSNILRENEKCRQVVISIVDGYETFSEFFGPGAQPGNDRRKMLQAFMDCGLIPAARVPEYYSDNMFTEAGKDFIENVLASIILDPDSLKVAGAEGVKRFRQILITSLPVLIANENLSQGSLKKYINEAIIIQYRLQPFGSFDEYLVNQSLFEEDTPDVKSFYINRLLDQGRNKFKEQIIRYNEAIKSNSGSGLFGESAQLTPDEIFQKTIVAVLHPVDVRLIDKKFGNLIQAENMKTEKVNVVINTETLSPTEAVANSELFADDNFYAKHPDKILGIPFTASGRFGPVTKYKGDITVLDRIDVPDNFIGNERINNNPLLSVDTEGNLTAKVMQPDVAQFIREVNQESEKTVGKILARKQRKKSKAVDDEGALTREVPELQTFEDIYAKHNPEISRDELEVFVWYKSSIDKPLSLRWARLIYEDLPGNPNEAYKYTVPEMKVTEWVNKGLLYYFEAKLVPAVLYLSGDIYDKKFQLERDREQIVSRYGQSVYDSQETALQEVFRTKYEKRLTIGGPGSDNNLVVLPLSKFAEEFFIEHLESMPEDTRFKIRMVTARTAKRHGQPDFLKDEQSREYEKEEFEKLNLKDAFTHWINTAKPELKENVTHQELVKFYMLGSPMRSKLGEDAPAEALKAEQAQFAKLKASLQKEAERLFGIFLDQELTLNDKVRLETQWNAQYNNYVPINYDKIPVAFTMTRYYKGRPEDLRPEKREAVATLLSNGTGCLAYDVGVGKTPSAIFTISAFMDAGYCRRPFICVPNQVYKQFISEIKGFAPHIPIIEAYNFSENYVENFKDANGNITAVPEGTITVMTYEGLEQIGFSDLTFNSMFNRLYEILNQGGESERKPTKRQTASFEERLQTLLGKGLKGSLYNIEDFQFDFACYDEAHRLKKIFTAVKGEAHKDEKGQVSRDKSPYTINSGAPSAIGLKAFMLNQYILQENDYQNILLLTATPFTNSPLEIFSMLAMLAYEQLQDTDLNNIKNFFDTYVKTSTDLVIRPNLKPEYRQVILGFNNLISLQSLIRRYINYKTGEDVNVQRPKKYVIPYTKKIVDGTVIALDEKEKVESFLTMTPMQKAMNDDIIAYVEGKLQLSDLMGSSYRDTEPGEGDVMDEDTVESDATEVDEGSLSDEEKVGVRMLRGINMARNNALSPYLYIYSGLGKPTYKEYVESSPKLMYVMGCIKTVMAYHEAKGEPVSAQVIYMDRGIEYFDLVRQYLIEEVGFKPNEVGIIKSGMPAGSKKGSKEYIKNLFNGETYNEGTKMYEQVADELRIKIVEGSSTIKEGINLQRYATVLYDLWEDWNPTDLLQLEGRIWRQGNLFNAVRIVHPLLLDSMDIFIFQKQQEKTSRLNTIWATDGRTNVLKLEEFDASELKYALIRDPHAIAHLKVVDQKAALDSEITGIKRLEDRVQRIKDNVDQVNRYFTDLMKLVRTYRNFESTNDKLKDATKAAQMLSDIVRKQTDKQGRKLAYKFNQDDPNVQYSDLDPIGKPYWFDEFNQAQRDLQRELKDFIGPAGFSFSLDDVAGLDAYKVSKQADIEKITEKIAALQAPENIDRIAKEVIEERNAKKITYKPLSEVVNDFAKLNYLLSDRKVASVVPAVKFTSCPPMENGQLAVSDEALAFLEECVEDEPTTKEQHLIPGTEQYRPERVQLHDKIIEDEFKHVRCVKQAKPIGVFTSGAPGAGKTTMLKKYADYLLSPDIFQIAADEIRTALPEYTGWNAHSTHRESQDIVARLLDRIGGEKCRFDFIYDGTMNKTQRYFKLINRVKAMGYETYIISIQVPYGVAKKRVLERYQKTGRYVPMSILDNFYEVLPSGKTRGQDALDQIKPVVDGYIVIDGITGKIIEKGGKPIPKDRKYGNFLEDQEPRAAEEVKEIVSEEAMPALPAAAPAPAKRDLAEKQINALRISAKFLKGDAKKKADKQIASLQLSLKYL